jgi:hypothetical protein
VVVKKDSKSAVTYTVRQVPGVVQFCAASRDEAVRLAHGFAVRNAVDLWSCEDRTYTLLEGHRRDEGESS